MLKISNSFKEKEIFTMKKTLSILVLTLVIVVGCSAVAFAGTLDFAGITSFLTELKSIISSLLDIFNLFTKLSALLPL